VVEHLPVGNEPLRTAHAALTAALASHPGEHREFWASFLQHELEPWEAWIDVEEGGTAPLIFWGRACLRPSLEWTAEHLLERFPLSASWQKGYCPICGSLPALLYLHGQGERQGFCSWCGTEWGLARLQCPHCDNRDPDSLGYLYPEGEPNYRVQYCRSCRMYFKLIDQRELLAPLFLPLEDWTTLHLDFLAQREAGINRHRRRRPCTRLSRSACILPKIGSHSTGNDSPRPPLPCARRSATVPASSSGGAAVSRSTSLGN
jgi:FdhE protein